MAKQLEDMVANRVSSMIGGSRNVTVNTSPRQNNIISTKNEKLIANEIANVVAIAALDDNYVTPNGNINNDNKINKNNNSVQHGSQKDDKDVDVLDQIHQLSTPQ